MKTKMLRWIAPAVLSLALAACSDDDAPSDPAGTVTLNMLDAENGKTYLGSTGFYINEADNFYGTGPFWIADVGPVRGIGSAERLLTKPDLPLMITLQLRLS